MGGTVYDKAKYHFSGDWPTDLPVEHAYHHGGMFLGWLVERDLVSEFFKSEGAAEIREFKRRKITAPELYRAWDGVLTDDMLSTEGNAFAGEYFNLSTGPYVTEYGRLLADGLETTYHVEDTWESFERLKRHLDERFAAWRATRS